MTDKDDQDKEDLLNKDPKDMTDEEREAYRELKMKQRIEEIRRRDPFIYH